MNSSINWVGGKSKLYKTIISIMPEHKCYVEAFAGGIWILINKPKVSVEVMNDINKELVNFYEVVQNEYNEMKEKFKFIVSSRDMFEKYISMTLEEINSMNKIERAVRFLYINRCSHSGLMKNYGYSNIRRSKVCIVTDDFDKLIGETHKRIKDVYIEQGDYKNIIDRYDKRESAKEEQKVLFYFDPPYYQTYDYQGNPVDYEELKNKLSSMKSYWILSVKDSEFVRKLFKEYKILAVEVKENIVNNKLDCDIRRELIILNYEPSVIPKNTIVLSE